MKGQRDVTKAVVIIDVANAVDADFVQLLREIKEEVGPSEKWAFASFRQRHLDELSIEFHQLGVWQVHCPMWSNGGQEPDNTRRFKSSDDPLLQRFAYSLLEKRPEIKKFIFVGCDSDLMAVMNEIRDRGKEAIFYYNPADASLGRVLAGCGFLMKPFPVRQQRGQVKKSGDLQQATRTVANSQSYESNGPSHPEDAILSDTGREKAMPAVIAYN